MLWKDIILFRISSYSNICSRTPSRLLTISNTFRAIYGLKFLAMNVSTQDAIASLIVIVTGLIIIYSEEAQAGYADAVGGILV